MITMHKTLQLFVAVLLAGTGLTVNAQTTFESNAPFVAAGTAPVTNQSSLPATDQLIFGFVPSNPDLNVSHPSHAGVWITQDTATPQAQIDSVRLYAYALETGVFQHIAARFRFWNAYQAPASSVFSKPSEYVVGLTACPCNFVAGNVYYVDVALPKPVYTEAASLGFSQVWETDSGDGVLTVSTDLVPALDTSPGSETAGMTIAGYGNLGRSPDDLDFAPADEPGGGRLGLGLNGVSMTLDQCTGAATFRDQFDEEFDDADAFFQRWNANPNAGTFAVGSGRLALSAPNNVVQFPYIASSEQATMIPPTGNFEVRWLAVYAGVGPAGDGEMVLSKGTPLNGNDGNADPSSVALRSWQDAGGFHVYANTSGGVQTIGGGQGTTMHDMEYCWVNGNVEVWKDGQKILSQTAQPAQRPDSIWLGNPVVTGSAQWNPVNVYRVLVRGDQATTLSDLIFSDGFDPPPGNR
jgi:hypothetical protein